MLCDVLPRQQLVDRFGASLILEEFGKAEMARIKDIKPATVFGIGASVWNRIVTKRWKPVQPHKMARYFQTTDPNLPVAIGKLIKEEVIQDIYLARGWAGNKRDENLVVELLVAKVYRQDLHLADITFMDPTSPIAESERRFELQSHRGLGLVRDLMQNLERVAREHHCQQITLTAGTRDLVGLFNRYGFDVEDSVAGRIAMQVGAGIPMERNA
jgi:hypothetical protein